MNEQIDIFLSSFSKELQSKVNRLDDIIGRDHWLSVGTYKESLLKEFLRKVLPKKYEVSSGFIVSANKEGELLKSTQMDIIIWNSSDYSPFFKDGDFVMIPPEACQAIVEVKSRLHSGYIKRSIENFDHFTKFYMTPMSTSYPIKKYIFSFDLHKNLQFPTGILSNIADYYNQSKLILIQKRQEFIEIKKREDSFSLDGIFILGHGLIKKDVRMFPGDKYHLIFKAYSSGVQNNDLVYASFEDELQKSLRSPTFSKQSDDYIQHPGNSAFKGILAKVPLADGQSKVIIPPILKKDLFPQWKENEFHPKSFIENQKI